jgi:hypothetical protein
MEVVGETGGEDSGETIGTRHKAHLSVIALAKAEGTRHKAQGTRHKVQGRHKAHLSAVPIAIGISEGGRGYRTFRMKLEIGLRRMFSVDLSIQRNVPYL